MAISLETLEMTPQERAVFKDLIRDRAYFLWLDAGRPHGRELDSWIEAEAHWIEHDYVPRRPLDGHRPMVHHCLPVGNATQSENEKFAARA